jgi:RNA polymerase sigma-70 factor (ECF subfamily)
MDETQWTEWAAATQRGDRDSFRRLVESATRVLIAIAFRFTRDWESARDLTQDTWIKVHRGIHRYDHRRPFRSWLYAVHRNTCLNHLRSPAVRREVATPPAELAALSPPVPEGDAGAGPEHREFEYKLKRALAQLSESQRNVITKVMIDQLTQREAAESLGMGFTTLRTTLHFARKRLAGIMRELEDTP